MACAVQGGPELLRQADTSEQARLVSRFVRAVKGPAPADQIYAYDRLDRVTDDGAAIVYDAAGNISSRGPTGYTYAAGTHRMTGHGATGYGYDANGNVTSITGGTQRTIAPTAFNLPSSITQGSTTLSYVYDGAHRRIKETASTPAGTTTTYYLGGYEELTRTDGVTERRHWIGTPEGAAGIHTTRSDGSTELSSR